MTKLADFNKHSLSDNADSVANYFPGGEVFANSRIEGTKTRRLLEGLAPELQRQESLIEDLVSEYFPDNTQAFIEEWERVVGIPDNCFGVANSIDERRENVLIKLSSLNLQTRQDFVGLAALFGFNVEIRGGTEIFEAFTLTFPINFEPSSREDRHTMYVFFQPGTLEEAFTYTFPLPFGSGRQSIMECWFNELAPANVFVIFET